MRTTGRRRTLLAGGLAALLLTALTACGGDEPAEETEPAAESATSSPSESESEPAESEESDTPEASSGGLSEDELVDAMASAMEDYGSAHIEMKSDGAAGKMDAEGDVSYGGDSPSMQMTMKMPALSSSGGDIEMRLLDGVMYMSMPPMTPAGKFMKIDTNDPNGPLGGMDGLSDQMDPRASLDAFKKGLEKLEYVGEEEVDGETMGHYVLTVDTEAALEANGGMAGSTQGVPKTITYDLWLDGDNLMRKMAFDLMDTKMTMTMSDWGKPVDVKAPPASAIVTQPGA